MRFNSVCTLVALTESNDAEGNAIYEREETEVFCNEYSVSASAFMAAQAAGLHADAEIQLRTDEYDGQETAILDGQEYSIERVENTGDFTRLTLAERLTND